VDVLTDLRCTLRRRDGTVTNAEVTVSLDPSRWTADDAKEALWAVIRLLQAPAVDPVSLVEVEPAR
jgi:hypothetical protein